MRAIINKPISETGAEAYGNNPQQQHTHTDRGTLESMTIVTRVKQSNPWTAVKVNACLAYLIAKFFDCALMG